LFQAAGCLPASEVTFPVPGGNDAIFLMPFLLLPTDGLSFTSHPSELKNMNPAILLE
jgi:hypothetical protein